MNKVTVLLFNFTISLSLLLIIFLLTYFAWYPPPFFESDGGWQGIKILIGVEIVLGPLLFFIIYKPGKPGLIMDIAIVSVIRVLALTTGIWIIHQERPVAAVYSDGYFATVTENQLASRQYDLNSLSEFGNTLPVWIFADLPRNTDDLQELRLQSLRTRIPIYLHTEYYRPMDNMAFETIRANAIEIQSLVNLGTGDTHKLRQFVTKYGDTMDNYILVPWHSRYSRKIIVLDAKTQAYVASLDIAPPTANASSGKNGTDRQLPEQTKGD